MYSATSFLPLPSLEYVIIFLRGALASVTALISAQRCSTIGMPNDARCPTSICIKQKGNNGDEIKRKGCSIIAPTPTNNASWPPRYTHPRITWFRPALCCNGTSLQAGTRLPGLIRCTSAPPRHPAGGDAAHGDVLISEFPTLRCGMM